VIAPPLISATALSMVAMQVLVCRALSSLQHGSVILCPTSTYDCDGIREANAVARDQLEDAIGGYTDEPIAAVVIVEQVWRSRRVLAAYDVAQVRLVAELFDYLHALVFDDDVADDSEAA
jgi:hypothetical protein